MKEKTVFDIADFILNRLYEQYKINSDFPSLNLIQLDFKVGIEKPEDEYKLYRDAITLLLIDEFISYDDKIHKKEDNSNFRITQKGIHFKLTDSYMKRYRRWNYEKDLKAFTYYAFWLPIAISIISLSVTIHDKFMKNDTKQIQSELQEIQKATRKTPEFQVNSPVKTDTLRNQ